MVKGKGAPETDIIVPRSVTVVTLYDRPDTAVRRLHQAPGALDASLDVENVACRYVGSCDERSFGVF